MAKDINLLPEQMRGKEEKIKATFKKRKAEPFEISQPKKEAVKKEKKIKTPLPKAAPSPRQVLSPQESISKKKPFLVSTKYLWRPFKKISEILHLIGKAKKREKPKLEEKRKEESEKEEPVAEVIPKRQPEAKREGEVPEISLMPRKEVIIPRLVRERILIFIAGLIIIIFLVLVIHLYVFWHFEALANEARTIQGDLATTEARIQLLLPRRSELARLESKASRVDELLEEHIYWTKLFHLLETYTLPGVSWGDFAADTKGKLHLSGSAKDLPTVARQIVVFSQASDFIKDFSISAVSIGETADFSIDLELAEGVFKR